MESVNTFEQHIILIEPMYQTDEGLEFIPDPNDYVFMQEKSDEGKFKLAFRFQTVDCAEIYAIFNSEKWTNSFELYKYTCLQRNTKKELYKLLIEGEFDIGVSRLNSYQLIKHHDITSYNHDDNDEIRLHYTQPRSVSGNVAWRSITWDLFKDIVDDMNKKNDV